MGLDCTRNPFSESHRYTLVLNLPVNLKRATKIYRYWLRPGGTKETTKLSSSSRALIFPFRVFCLARKQVLILPDPARGGSCCCHVSHVRSSVSTRLPLSRVILVLLGLGSPIQSTPFALPKSPSTPFQAAPFKLPSFKQPQVLDNLLVLLWC